MITCDEPSSVYQINSLITDLKILMSRNHIPLRKKDFAILIMLKFSRFDFENPIKIPSKLDGIRKVVLGNLI